MAKKTVIQGAEEKPIPSTVPGSAHSATPTYSLVDTTPLKRALDTLSKEETQRLQQKALPIAEKRAYNAEVARLQQEDGALPEQRMDPPTAAIRNRAYIYEQAAYIGKVRATAEHLRDQHEKMVNVVANRTPYTPYDAYGNPQEHIPLTGPDDPRAKDGLPGFRNNPDGLRAFLAQHHKGLTETLRGLDPTGELEASTMLPVTAKNLEVIKAAELERENYFRAQSIDLADKNAKIRFGNFSETKRKQIIDTNTFDGPALKSQIAALVEDELADPVWKTILKEKGIYQQTYNEFHDFIAGDIVEGVLAKAKTEARPKLLKALENQLNRGELFIDRSKAQFSLSALNGTKRRIQDKRRDSWKKLIARIARSQGAINLDVTTEQDVQSVINEHIIGTNQENPYAILFEEMRDKGGENFESYLDLASAEYLLRGRMVGIGKNQQGGIGIDLTRAIPGFKSPMQHIVDGEYQQAETLLREGVSSAALIDSGNLTMEQEIFVRNNTNKETGRFMPYTSARYDTMTRDLLDELKEKRAEFHRHPSTAAYNANKVHTTFEGIHTDDQYTSASAKASALEATVVEWMISSVPELNREMPEGEASPAVKRMTLPPQAVELLANTVVAAMSDPNAVDPYTGDTNMETYRQYLSAMADGKSQATRLIAGEKPEDIRGDFGSTDLLFDANFWEIMRDKTDKNEGAVALTRLLLVGEQAKMRTRLDITPEWDSALAEYGAKREQLRPAFADSMKDRPREVRIIARASARGAKEQQALEDTLMHILIGEEARIQGTTDIDVDDLAERAELMFGPIVGTLFETEPIPTGFFSSEDISVVVPVELNDHRDKLNTVLDQSVKFFQSVELVNHRFNNHDMLLHHLKNATPVFERHTDGRFVMRFYSESGAPVTVNKRGPNGGSLGIKPLYFDFTAAMQDFSKKEPTKKKRTRSREDRTLAPEFLASPEEAAKYWVTD